MTCQTCQFYWSDVSRCRRRSPSAEGWPTVQPEDTCGEWEAAVAIPEAMQQLGETIGKMREAVGGWRNDRMPWLGDLSEDRTVWVWFTIFPHRISRDLLLWFARKLGKIPYWAPGNLPAPTDPPPGGERPAADPAPEPATFPEIKVGQVWRRRDGEVVTVSGEDVGSVITFYAGDFWYKLDGTAPFYHAPRPEYDLIELVSEPSDVEPEPARESVPEPEPTPATAPADGHASAVQRGEELMEELIQLQDSDPDPAAVSSPMPESATEPAPKPALRVGQVWRTRNGEEVTITGNTGRSVYSFRASNNCSYTPSGCYWCDEVESHRDLVELIHDAPTDPAPATAPANRWIVDRLPTEEDADDNLDVFIASWQSAVFSWTLLDWRYVHPGIPWSPVHIIPDKPWDPTSLDRNGWIRSRLPTVEDGNYFGYVKVPSVEHWTWTLYSYIVPGQPWAPARSSPGEYQP